MKRLTITTIGMLSISAYAQPTYITQLNENDTWLKTSLGYTSAKSEYDIDTSGNSRTPSTKTKGLDVTIVKMSQASPSFTPGFAASLATIDDDGTNVSVFEVAGIARMNLGSLPSAISLGYQGTSKSDYRDSIIIDLNIGSKSEKSDFFNEFNLSYQSFIEANNVSGADTLSLLNTSSFNINDKIDLVTHFGASFISDAEVHNVKAVSYGTEINFGLGLDVDIDPSNTIQLSLTRSISDNEEFFGISTTEVENTDTTFNVSLLKRF